MIEILDLVGASGASYRFRLVEPARLPVTAGNFALVRFAGGAPEVVCLGSANKLLLAEDAQAEVVRSNGEVALYMRLNIGRGLRVAEHEDLMGAYRPPFESVLEDDRVLKPAQ